MYGQMRKRFFHHEAACLNPLCELQPAVDDGEPDTETHPPRLRSPPGNRHSSAAPDHEFELIGFLQVGQNLFKDLSSAFFNSNSYRMT
jgi:hypothetical protein